MAGARQPMAATDAPVYTSERWYIAARRWCRGPLFLFLGALAIDLTALRSAHCLPGRRFCARLGNTRTKENRPIKAGLFVFN